MHDAMMYDGEMARGRDASCGVYLRPVLVTSG